jgi:hypothetical protein
MHKTNVLFFMLILWGFFNGNAQEAIFSNPPSSIGGFFGANLQVGPVAGETAVFTSLRGGVTFDRKLSIGGAYSFTVNDFTPSSESDQEVYLDMWMGGLLVEYSLNPDKLVHLTFPLVLGAGEAELDWREGALAYGSDPLFGEANFFFLEPGAALEVNLLPFLQIQGGLSYRLIPGQVDYRGLDQGDLSGFTGLLGLRFHFF